MLRSAHGRAVAIVFTASGIVTGTLSSRWPWIAGRLHLTSALVGAMGLASTAGALATMPFAARFVHRYGTKAAIVFLTVALGITLVFPPVAPTAIVLAVIMVVMGAVAGTQDTAINTAGVETETHLGRSIMSGLHGMWSVGVLLGALVGSVVARENIDPRIQFPVMGALIIAGGLAAIAWLKGEPAAERRGGRVRADVRVAARPGAAHRPGGLRGYLRGVRGRCLGVAVHALDAARQPGRGRAHDRDVRAGDGGGQAQRRCGGAVDRAGAGRPRVRRAGDGRLPRRGRRALGLGGDRRVHSHRTGRFGGCPAGLRGRRSLGAEPGDGRRRRRDRQLRGGPGRAERDGGRRRYRLAPRVVRGDDGARRRDLRRAGLLRRSGQAAPELATAYGTEF